jgi:hypothetical protein
MSARQELMFDVIEQLSNKYKLDFMSMQVHVIRETINSEEWIRLHNAIKYGKELH